MRKLSELDAAISKRLREYRISAGLTQPQVAAYLGITYQSYQKMERGGHSFRVSVLDRLAMLFNKRVQDFLGPDEGQIDPAITRATLIFHSMSDAQRDAAIDVLTVMKHGERS